VVRLTPPLEFHDQMKPNKTQETEVKKICCPHCKSENTKKRGFRQTENRGKIQRHFCNKCKKSFVIDDGFFRMRNHPKKITCALDLFYRGISTRKVQGHFKAFYPHNSSNVSVYNWIVKYSKMISNFTDKLKINNGNEIQLDEMEYHRRETHKKKGLSKDWFIDSIDTQTRFLLSAEYVKSRGKTEITYAFKQTKERARNHILLCTTDGLLTYPEVIKRVFTYRALRTKEVIHNRVNASKGEGFNIYIERLHNSLRQRTESFRGFHGSIESANSIMKGLVIFYNFIRVHQAIKCCPYELAIPELKLNSENKWLELIQISKQ
jgi:putative transposase